MQGFAVQSLLHMFVPLMKTEIEIVDCLLLTFRLCDSLLALSLSTLCPERAAGSYTVKGMTAVCAELKRFGAV